MSETVGLTAERVYCDKDGKRAWVEYEKSGVKLTQELKLSTPWDLSTGVEVFEAMTGPRVPPEVLAIYDDFWVEHE